MALKSWGIFWCLIAVLLTPPAALPFNSNGSLPISQAREARDRSDVQALQVMIASARNQTSGSDQAYIRLALFENWLCEAARVRQNNKLLKEAAEAGVAAARKAVQLDPNSSPAHWLMGDMLKQLIPLVFGGGMRYGPESNRQVEKAIQLDPKNANAYITRAVSYYYMPAMFGGDKQKAVEFFRKAIDLDPSSDAAATAHIWLAQFDLAQAKQREAAQEIQSALKIDPQRLLAQQLQQQVADAPEKR
ncbi:MAG: TRAP transporter TatT component family protein [Terriglobia bacterium]